MASEPLTPPALPEARAGDPITSANWNAMVRAVKGLQGIFQQLETQQPSAILVTARAALARRLALPDEVALVYAIAEANGLPTPPAERRGDGYRIANLPPGRYQVVVEATPQSGLAGRTQPNVLLAQGQTAVVQIELFPVGVAATVPSLFGHTLQEAAVVLEAVGLAVGQVVDAHGQAISLQDLRRFANRRVVSTEPGVDMPAPPGADGQRRVNLLVAGQLEIAERLPRLVAQLPVARPIRVMASPDGAKVYALSLGAQDEASITVINTQTRRVTQTIPLALSGGTTTPLDLVFHPDPTLKRAFLLAAGAPLRFTLGGFRPDILEIGAPRPAAGELAAPAVLARRAPIGMVAAIDAQRDRIMPGGIVNVPLGSDIGLDRAGQRLFVAAPAQRALLAVDLQNRTVNPVLPDAFGQRNPAFIATAQGELLVSDVSSPTIVAVPDPVTAGQVRLLDLSAVPASAALDLVAATVGPGEGRRRVAYVVARRAAGIALTAAFLETNVLVEVDLASGAVQAIENVRPLAIQQPQTVLSGLAVTPDGARLCVGVDGGVAVINTADRTVITTVPLEGQPIGLTVTPDGAQLYVANLEEDVVQVIDLTGTEDPYRPPIFRTRLPIGSVLLGRFGELAVLGSQPALARPGLSAGETGGFTRPGGSGGTVGAGGLPIGSPTIGPTLGGGFIVRRFSQPGDGGPGPREPGGNNA